MKRSAKSCFTISNRWYEYEQKQKCKEGCPTIREVVCSKHKYEKYKYKYKTAAKEGCPTI